MLHMGYDRKGSVEKFCVHQLQRGSRQDELIGGKLPVVKLSLSLTLKVTSKLQLREVRSW
jgi:hypothetical protein